MAELLPLWRVELEGDKVEHEFRIAPDYFDKDGKPRTGEKDGAPKLVKKREGWCELRALDRDHAVMMALSNNPDYSKVVSVKKIG